jgi:hypothetical protein
MKKYWSAKFSHYTSTCLVLARCPSSGGNSVYMQQMVRAVHVSWLNKLKINSASSWCHYTRVSRCTVNSTCVKQFRIVVLVETCISFVWSLKYKQAFVCLWTFSSQTFHTYTNIQLPESVEAALLWWELKWTLYSTGKGVMNDSHWTVFQHVW